MAAAGARASSPAELHGCTDDEFAAVLGDPTLPTRMRLVLPWVGKLEGGRVDGSAAPAQDATHAGVSGGAFLAALEHPIECALRRVRERALELQAEAPVDPGGVARLLFDEAAPKLGAVLLPTAVLELNAARVRGRLAGSTKEERFATFVEQLRDPRKSLALLREYPVLARLVDVWLEEWVTTSIELLQRLAGDWEHVRSTLAGGGETGQLAHVAVAGDRHRRGRSVAILTFASGFKVVYKPRSVAVERHFQDLLRWLNDHSELPPFRVLAIVDRETHGWVEHVEPASCGSVEEVARFYERQGGYLAVLQALSAVDFHSENILAVGEHPVLVDLEGLFHQTALGLPADVELDDSERQAFDLTAESVLRVGFLPQRMWGDAQKRGMDVSALGSAPGQPYPIRLTRWEEPETDEMHRTLTDSETRAVFNRPALGEVAAAADDYVEDVIAGFAKAYEALRNHAEDLVAPGGAIAAFAGDETRVLFRPTTSYALVLQSSFHPQFLRDGLDRDRRLDRLLVHTPESPAGAALIASERRDLWRCDIPIFTTRPDSRHVWDGDGERIDDALAEAGMELARRRLARMSDADLARQCSLIRTSLATAELNSAHTLDYPRLAVATSPAVPERGELVDAARSIGDRLCELAVRADTGATWIGVNSERGSDWSIAPVGPNLYDGLAGIALFLASLGALAEDLRYTELARAGVSVMRKQLARTGAPSQIGAFGGTAGNVYALTHLSVLWDDTTLLREAEGLAAALGDGIDGDAAFDVVSGAAGCIVPLLNLYRIAPSDAVLETAVRCGDHLVASATRVDHGIAWHVPGVFSTPLAGFAHGAAGYAWALLELYGATAEARFRDMAIEAIRYERSLFSPKAENWRDVRDDRVRSRLGDEKADGYFMSYWCHGAAGVGLARLRCREHWHDAAFADEITVAIRTTLASGFGLNHSLCHGDLGNADFLLDAGLRLGDPRLLRAAQEAGARVLAGRQTHGWITGYPRGLESPGLMTGLAGIGYGLLRLADPARVPSVLALDPITG